MATGMEGARWIEPVMWRNAVLEIGRDAVRAENHSVGHRAIAEEARWVVAPVQRARALGSARMRD